MSELPDSIANLKSLRYLNLSNSDITRLPESIGHLHSLILSHCSELTMLPMGIGKLINLGHLDICYTSQLKEMPYQIGSLTNLQTLSKFIVGQGRSLGLPELKNMHAASSSKNLRIQGGLHNVLNIGDGRDANLESGDQIEELTMKWSDEFGASRNEMHEVHVLERLKPHKV